MAIVNLRGIDAAGHPSAAAVKAAGCNVVGFYLPPNRFAPTPTTVASYLAAGLGLLSIFETGAENALGGSAAAVSDAHTALASIASYKQPQNTAIVATVDFEPSAAQLGSVAAYIETFASVLSDAKHLTTGYGGTAVLEKVAILCDFTWQAAGWSNGVLFPANMRQAIAQISVGGVQCDQDTILKLPFGAWCSTGVYPPTPAPMTADQFAAAHDMSQIDDAEAHLAVLAHLAWYTWTGTSMEGHSNDGPFPKETLFAFTANLNAAGIYHAGP